MVRGVDGQKGTTMKNGNPPRCDTPSTRTGLEGYLFTGRGRGGGCWCNWDEVT